MMHIKYYFVDMRIHHIEPSNNTNYSVGSEERVPPLSDITNGESKYHLFNILVVLLQLTLS